jgi:hypothetical protein
MLLFIIWNVVRQIIENAKHRTASSGERLRLEELSKA